VGLLLLKGFLAGWQSQPEREGLFRWDSNSVTHGYKCEGRNVFLRGCFLYLVSFAVGLMAVRETGRVAERSGS